MNLGQASKQKAAAPRLCSQPWASIALGSPGHQCLGRVAQRGRVILRAHVLFAVTFAKIRRTQRSRTAAGGVRQECGRPGLPSPPRPAEAGRRGPGGDGGREGGRPPAPARRRRPGPARPAGGGGAGSEEAGAGHLSGAEPGFHHRRAALRLSRPAHKGPGRRGRHPHRSRRSAAAACLPPSSRSLSSSSSSSSLLHGDARAMDASCLRGSSLLLFLGECRRRVSPPRVGAGGTVASRCVPLRGAAGSFAPHPGAGAGGVSGAAEWRGWGVQ